MRRRFLLRIFQIVVLVCTVVYLSLLSLQRQAQYLYRLPKIQSDVQLILAHLQQQQHHHQEQQKQDYGKKQSQSSTKTKTMILDSNIVEQQPMSHIVVERAADIDQSIPELSSSSSISSDTTAHSSVVILSGVPNETAFAVQQQVREEIQSYLHPPSGSRPPFPPKTPGAYIHIGKTGGSTLSTILEHACHSFIRKPCPVAKSLNETTLLSKTTTYIHTPDFPRLNTTTTAYGRYSFYVVSIRDPLERTMSGFTWEHPENNQTAFKLPLKRLYTCFPTLERFADYVGDHPQDHTYHQTRSSKHVNVTNCTNLARGILDGQSRIPQHLHFGLKVVLETYSVQYRRLLAHDDLERKKKITVNHDKNQKDLLAILVLRNEYLWQDFVSANHWLSGGGESESSSSSSAMPSRERLSNTQMRKQVVFPVTRDISPLGRQRLCRALQDEYRAYVQVLRRAVNLSPHQKNDSVQQSRRHCPILQNTTLNVVFV
ncbi:hypothetical protein ACA910_021898 [Epithemia clementina (nom. ined.)]